MYQSCECIIHTGGRIVRVLQVNARSQRLVDKLFCLSSCEEFAGDSLETGQLKSMEEKQLPSQSASPQFPRLCRDAKHGFLDKMTCRQGLGV